MRYSAVQEDSYGVGLGQETPLNNVDESMMAATGDIEPGGESAVEEGSMISNLPLLFASGYPTSLEKISLPELERFITFMVQCSLGPDSAEVVHEPQWWPKEIKFSIPLLRPKKINESYMDNLKKLVFRCYTYHRSEYLLRFCSYLAQYPHDKLEYVNNWDSTTSLYLKTTGKLLVTFRNENMNYDKKKIVSPRKKLLPVKKSKEYPSHTKCLRRRSQRQASSPAMVEPPTYDIYLCDNCDAEFIGLHQMKEHEKLCYHVEPRPPTPIDLEEEPELTQEQFMDYFLMRSKNPSDSHGSLHSKTSTLDNSSQHRSSSRIRGSINLTRCPTIPFSSPAGLALAKKSKMMTEDIQQERLDRVERHLHAPPIVAGIKPKWLTKTYEFDRWSVSYKANTRDKTNNPEEYVRLYNFNFSGKPVLDLRSQLLYIACKPIYVMMEQTSDEKIEELKRDPSRYKSPELKLPLVRLRLPSVETARDPQPGDESNPIIIDLEDDEPPPPPPPSSPPPPPPPPLSQLPRFPVPTKSPAVATVTPIMAPTNRFPTKSTSTKPSNLKRPRPTSQSPDKSIIVVDLCSSDEDEQGPVKNAVNMDLMHKRKSTKTTTTTVNASSLDMSDFQNPILAQSRLYSDKPCLSPADSTTNWLMNLSVDSAQRRKNGFHEHATSVFKNIP